MTMLTPDDPGSGRLFFWTRQGISLQELYDIIAEVIAQSPGGSGTNGGGTTFTGEITADQIKDATDVGQATITAAGATFTDRQAASRAAMGAGTSSLVIGTAAGTAADGAIVAGIAAGGGGLAATVPGAHEFTGAVTFSGTVGFVDGSITEADVANLVADLASLKANGIQRIEWNPATGSYPAEIAGYGCYWYYGPVDQPPSAQGRTLRDGDIVDLYTP